MTLGKGGGEIRVRIGNLVPIHWMDSMKEPGDEVERVVVEAFSRMIEN